MQQQILIPLDGSALAEAILPHAVAFALATGSALTLLSVIPLTVVFDPTYGPLVMPEQAPFMAYPDVPPDNKSSERAIKAAKVKDKVSGGFRSVQGATRFAQLLSLTQTLRKQKLAILPTLIAIFKGIEGAVSFQ